MFDELGKMFKDETLEGNVTIEWDLSGFITGVSPSLIHYNCVSFHTYVLKDLMKAHSIRLMATKVLTRNVEKKLEHMYVM